MKIFSSKKRVAAIGVVTAATLVGGGVAFAYWTTTGAGTGEAKVGTTEAITITGDVNAADLLAPGGLPREVSFTATNPAKFNQRLSKIKLVSISPDDGHSGCPTSVGDPSADFSMADVPMTFPGWRDLPAAPASGAPTAVVLPEKGALVMNNTTWDQDDCRGATLTLTFATE